MVVKGGRRAPTILKDSPRRELLVSDGDHKWFGITPHGNFQTILIVRSTAFPSLLRQHHTNEHEDYYKVMTAVTRT